MAKKKSEASSNGTGRKGASHAKKTTAVGHAEPAADAGHEHLLEHGHEHHAEPAHLLDQGHDGFHDEPLTYGFFGRMVYEAAYYVSYGVTFPAVFVARAIPTDNAIVHGFRDGAIAARETVAGLLEPQAHEAVTHEHGAEHTLAVHPA